MKIWTLQDRRRWRLKGRKEQWHNAAARAKALRAEQARWNQRLARDELAAKLLAEKLAEHEVISEHWAPSCSLSDVAEALPAGFTMVDEQTHSSFGIDGELREHRVQSEYDWEVECKVAEFLHGADDVECLPCDDELCACHAHASRWFLAENEGITHSEAEQADETWSRQQMDEPDHPCSSLAEHWFSKDNLWWVDHEGRERTALGAAAKTRLRHGREAQQERSRELHAWARRASPRQLEQTVRYNPDDGTVMSLRQFSTWLRTRPRTERHELQQQWWSMRCWKVARCRYRLSVAKCRELGDWSGLYLTKRQIESFESVVERRLAGDLSRPEVVVLQRRSGYDPETMCCHPPTRRRSRVLRF